jgi:FkbM family methyltransferase
MPRSVLKFFTRMFPIERGKFKILNSAYFPFFAPDQSTLVVSKISSGAKMSLDISEFLQSHIYLFGSYELPTIRFLRSMLTSNSVCFDIGAQIGYISIEMALIAKEGVVHAFEPEATNVNRLTNNIRLNHFTNINIIPRAVSNYSGTLKLYLSSDHNSGTHSTVPTVTNVSEQFVEIPCITLDEYVTQNSITRLDVIKIDVEGGELEVIQGACETLKSLKPTIIMEMADSLQESRNFSSKKFKILLSEFGYSAYTLSHSGRLIPSAFDAAHAMENVVFVHKAK